MASRSIPCRINLFLFSIKIFPFIQNPEEKKKAEVTFINIQQACDRLSNERQRRQRLNTQKRENPF